jgi:hypothetical protein
MFDYLCQMSFQIELSKGSPITCVILAPCPFLLDHPNLCPITSFLLRCSYASMGWVFPTSR